MALSDQVLLYDIQQALATVQLRQGRFADAISSIDAALKIRPKHGPGLAVKAEIYLRSDNSEQASRLLGQAVAEAPQHPYVLTIEALSQLSAQMIDVAEKTMTSAEQYGAANWAIGQEVRGDIAYLKGDEAAAKTHWLKARQMGGGSYKLEEKLSKGIYIK